jgi:His-Xaa-Ser system protein HxsD
MLEVRTTPAERRVVLALDEASCPRAAVYAAAFSFIDRCWVHLDRKDGRLEISLREKRAEGSDLEALAAQVRDELLGHAWRHKLVEDGRELLESLAVRAYGASAPPDQAGSLDDLLAGDDQGAFDDPLGIAMSWEEKYAKKSEGGAS